MAEAHDRAARAEAERGVPIVGCEPSCLLTLREEHLRCCPATRARRPWPRTRLVEELLVEAIDDGALRAAATPSARAGSSSTATATRRRSRAPPRRSRCCERIPGAEVVELDAGCCGMAGSFGFEAEHYELSMQHRRDAPVPGGAARSPRRRWSPRPGVSCRQQIAHGTGRPARHPVQLVREALHRVRERLG